MRNDRVPMADDDDSDSSDRSSESYDDDFDGSDRSSDGWGDHQDYWEDELEYDYEAHIEAQIEAFCDHHENSDDYED